LNHLTTPFSFKRTSFQPRLTISSTPQERLLECFENGETITSIGLPRSSNYELSFELDDVMAGIGISCKKNLPVGTIG
jgi:hypothetical protein